MSFIVFLAAVSASSSFKILKEEISEIDNASLYTVEEIENCPSLKKHELTELYPGLIQKQA